MPNKPKPLGPSNSAIPLVRAIANRLLTAMIRRPVLRTSEFVRKYAGLLGLMLRFAVANPMPALAGLPNTTEFSGTERVTNDPLAITELFPIHAF